MHATCRRWSEYRPHRRLWANALAKLTACGGVPSREEFSFGVDAGKETSCAPLGAKSSFGKWRHAYDQSTHAARSFQGKDPILTDIEQDTRVNQEGSLPMSESS